MGVSEVLEVVDGFCSLVGDGLELSLLALVSLATEMVDGRFVTVLEAGACRFEAVSLAFCGGFSFF